MKQSEKSNQYKQSELFSSAEVKSSTTTCFNCEYCTTRAHESSDLEEIWCEMHVRHFHPIQARACSRFDPAPIVRTGVNDEGRPIKYFEIDGKKEYLKEYNPIIPEAVKKKIRRDVIGIEENPNFVSKLMQKTQKTE